MAVRTRMGLKTHLGSGPTWVSEGNFIPEVLVLKLRNRQNTNSYTSYYNAEWPDLAETLVSDLIQLAGLDG